MSSGMRDLLGDYLDVGRFWEVEIEPFLRYSAKRKEEELESQKKELELENFWKQLCYTEEELAKKNEVKEAACRAREESESEHYHGLELCPEAFPPEYTDPIMDAHLKAIEAAEDCCRLLEEDCKLLRKQINEIDNELRMNHPWMMYRSWRRFSDRRGMFGRRTVRVWRHFNTRYFRIHEREIHLDWRGSDIASRLKNYRAKRASHCDRGLITLPRRDNVPYIFKFKDQSKATYGDPLRHIYPSESLGFLNTSIWHSNLFGNEAHNRSTGSKSQGKPGSEVAYELRMLLVQLARNLASLGEAFESIISERIQELYSLVSTLASQVGTGVPRSNSNTLLKILTILSSMPGSQGAAIDTSHSLNLRVLNPSASASLPVTPKECLAIALAILAFLTTSILAYHSPTPHQPLRISLLSSLLAYSIILSTLPSTRGAVILPLTYTYTVVNTFVLAFTDIKIILHAHAFKYAILHFAAQVLLAGAGAGILIALMSDMEIGYWDVVPHAAAIAVFVVAGLAKFVIWTWGMVSDHTKARVKAAFSAPIGMA